MAILGLKQLISHNLLITFHSKMYQISRSGSKTSILASDNRKKMLTSAIILSARLNMFRLRRQPFKTINKTASDLISLNDLGGSYRGEVVTIHGLKNGRIYHEYGDYGCLQRLST